MDNLPKLIEGSTFIVVVIMSMVEWLKQTRLNPSVYPYASMLIGLAFGGLWRYADAPFVTFGDWFLAGMYGIVLGLVASGVYKIGAGLAAKANPAKTEYAEPITEQTPPQAQP